MVNKKAKINIMVFLYNNTMFFLNKTILFINIRY